MTDKNEVVFPTDNEAASIKTITGWVSRNGKFFGEHEQLARNEGATHYKCEGCGEPTYKYWLKCQTCSGKQQREKYLQLQFKEWDGETPVYDMAGSNYFYSSDEIEEYCEENELNAQDLLLVVCKANYARHVNDSYWEDDLPEDGDIPKELQAKLIELNKFIDTLKPLSWSPTNIRTSYTEEK